MGIRIQQYGRGPRNVGIGGVDAGFQPTLRGVNGTEGQQVLGTLLGVGAKLTDVAVREFVSSETARVSQSLQQMNEELAAESSRYMSEHQGENALDAGAHFDRFARETAQKHLEEGGFQGRFAEQFQRQAAGEVLRFREQGEAYGAQQKAAWTNAVYQGSVQENLNGIAKNYNNPEYIEFSLANMDELVDGFFPGMDNRARKTAFREEAAGRIVEGYLADGNIDGARGALDRYRDLLGKQGDTFERAIRGRETLVAERERKERPVREFNRIMAEKERLIQLSENEAAGWQEARRLAAEVEDPEDRAAVMNMVMQEQNVGTRRRLASDMQKLMALPSGLSPAEQMEQLEAAGISAEGLQQVRTRLERGGATDPEAQRSGFMHLLWQAETALTDRESEETLLASAMQIGLDGEAARWVLKVRDGEYPGPQALSRALGAPVTDVALYLATCATLSQRGFNAENRPTESDLRSACAQAAGQLAMTYGGQNGTLVRASYNPDSPSTAEMPPTEKAVGESPFGETASGETSSAPSTSIAGETGKQPSASMSSAENPPADTPNPAESPARGIPAPLSDNGHNGSHSTNQPETTDDKRRRISAGEAVTVTPSLPPLAPKDGFLPSQAVGYLRNELLLNLYSDKEISTLYKKIAPHSKELDAFYRQHRKEGEPVWSDDAASSSQRASELSRKYPYSGHSYIFKGFYLVQSARNEIHAAAQTWGVAPQAIAAALADEYSTSVNLKYPFDEGQNLWASEVLDLSSIQLSYLDMFDRKGPRGKSRYFYSSNQDLGPGNIKARTALRLFEHYVMNDTGPNPITAYLYRFVSPDAPTEEKWTVFKKEMLLSARGSAWLAGAEMARGRDLLGPFMQGLPPEEQAAILVTWYKQGPNYMKRYLENRADRPASEWGAIAPGEGTGLLKFWKGINEALDGTYEYPFNTSKISVP